MPRICILLMLSSIFVVLVRVSHSEEIVTQQSQPRSLSPELVETVHTKLPGNGETSTVHASESLSQAQGEINFNLGDSTAPSLPSTAEQLTPTPDGERVFVVAAGAGGAAAVVVIPETGDKESGAADGDNGGLADQTSSGEPEVSESLSTVPATQADQAGQLDLHSLSVTEPVQEEQLLPTAPQITVLQDSGPTQSLELPQGDDLPAAQHTHHIAQDGGTQASFSQAERVTLEPVQATDSLHSLRPEAWTEVSQLPEGLGGRVIEPQLTSDPAQETSGESAAPAGGGGRAEEEAGVGEEEFPTFGQWSVQYLAEQEKQKAETEEPSPVVKASQKKLRQNFAAAACGAKVVSSNAEAEHTSYLLNGNPDEYMISPCKAKKWFVVELCEPLQIHKVELGTLELFSSQPKSFRLSASQRYPTKEWLPLGLFELSAERSVQSFATEVLEDFVKFVRVEMLEHHGNEHYCPITTFRVLGLDLASDDDDDVYHEHSDSEGPSDEAPVEDEIEESVNLFTSAKDTVVKLMKKVLYKGEEEAASASAEGAVDQSDNATAKSEEKTGEKKEELPCPKKLAEVQTPSGVPTVVLPDVGVITASVPVATSSHEAEEIPIVTKLDDTEQLPAEASIPPVVIKLESQEGDNEVVVTAEPAARGQHSSRLVCEYRPLHQYLQLMSASCASCSVSTVTSDLMCQREKDRRTLVPDIVHVDSSQHTPKSPVSLIEEKEEQTVKDTQVSSPESDKMGQSKHTSAPPDLPPKEQVVGDKEKAVSKNSEPELPKSSAEDSTLSVSEGSEISSQPQMSAAPTDSGTLPLQSPSQQQEQLQQTKQSSTEELSSSQSTSFTFDDVSSTRSETLEPSSLSSHADLEGGAASVVTPNLDIEQSRVVQQEATDITDSLFLKVAPSPTVLSEDSQDEMGLPVPETPSSSERHQQAPGTEEDQPGEKPAEKPVVAAHDSPEPSAEKAGASTPELPSQDNAGAGGGGQQPTAPSTGQSVNATGGQAVPSGAQKPSSPSKKGVDLIKVGMASNSKRDMSIMKLSSRIVALEQNVSMTKRYLEELSRAFKQQSEDMMRLLNKTISRLNSHVTQTEEKEVQQKLVIGVLEQKVTNLTRVVDVLQNQVDVMGKELNQRQWLLSIFQVLLFLWLLVSSYRGRSKPPLALSDHQFLLDTMPKQPQVEHVDTSSGQRRNSDVGVASAGAGSGAALKRQSSETSLVLGTGPSVSDSGRSTFHSPGVSQGSKKRKKKKMKHVESVLSISPTGVSQGSTFQPDPVQTPSFSSSAGVLFGARPPRPGGGAAEVDSDRSDKENQREDGKSRHFSSGGAGQEGRSVLTPAVVHGGSESQSGPVPSSPSGCVSGRSQDGWSQGGRVPPVIGKDDGPGCGPQFCIGGVSLEKTPPGHKFGLDRLRESPEFKQPAYHRNKVRKFGENTSNNSVWSGGQGGEETQELTSTYPPGPHNRTAMADVVGPGWSTEFFLSDNYLSENRFKFPASPTKDRTPEREESLLPPPSSAPPVTCSCMQNGHTAAESLPRRKSSSSSTKYSRPFHGRDESRVFHASSSSSFSSTPSLPPCDSLGKQPVLGPSFISFRADDGSSLSTSFNPSRQPPPRPPPPQRPPPPSHSPPPAFTKPRSSTAPLSPSTRVEGSLSFVKSESSSAPTGWSPESDSHSTKELSGNRHKKGAGSHQRHRRQGSFPLEQQSMKSRSMEKEVGPARQGTPEGPKQSGKLIGAQVLGAKVRKAQSEYSGSRGTHHRAGEGKRHSPPLARKGP